MSSYRQGLKQANLYLVLDRQVAGYDRLFQVFRQSVQAGIDIVQLRDKNGPARDICAFSRRAIKYLKDNDRRRRILFIMNDRADIALTCGCHGVHVGQDDLTLSEIRKLAGTKMIVGLSCQTLAHAQAAQRQGADYIGFGSIFKTKTKPDRQAMDLKLLSRVNKNIQIPLFAIGGINASNLEQVTARGVTRVAVTRAVCLSRRPGQAVRDLKKRLH